MTVTCTGFVTENTLTYGKMTFFSALNDIRGRLVPESKIKQLNRLFTFSGFLNGLQGKE
jgi:hypothetical protein